MTRELKLIPDVEHAAAPEAIRPRHPRLPPVANNDPLKDVSPAAEWRRITLVFAGGALVVVMAGAIVALLFP